jgi:hypothetical protein
MSDMAKAAPYDVTARYSITAAVLTYPYRENIFYLALTTTNVERNSISVKRENYYFLIEIHNRYVNHVLSQKLYNAFKQYL